MHVVEYTSFCLAKVQWGYPVVSGGVGGHRLTPLTVRRFCPSLISWLALRRWWFVVWCFITESSAGFSAEFIRWMSSWEWFITSCFDEIIYNHFENDLFRALMKLSITVLIMIYFVLWWNCLWQFWEWFISCFDEIVYHSFENDLFRALMKLSITVLRMIYFMLWWNCL